jgi:hypothetical protein
VWTHRYTCTYTYKQICISTYWYILLCTSMYQYILVFTSISTLFSCWGLGCVQDTIVVVRPYPYSNADDIENVLFAYCLYAHPQLFFECHLSPTGWLSPKNPSLWHHTPGWPDCGLGFDEEANSENRPSQAFWRDSWSLEGGWSVIKWSVLFCWGLYLFVPVHTSMYQYVLGIV